MELKELEDEIIRCSKCGFCQSLCPLYHETTEESLVARGKLALIDSFIHGELNINQRLSEKIMNCLLCLGCLSACPNGINIEEIFFTIRNEIAKKIGISFKKRAILWSLSKKNLTRLRPLLISTQKYLPQWYRIFLGKKRHLPEVKSLPEDIIKIENPVLRVGYFPGCLERILYPQIKNSVIKVLSHYQIEAVIPSDELCCGIPFLAAGRKEKAREMLEKNFKLFQNQGLKIIIISCASCGSMFKKGLRWLGISHKYKDFEIYDISEFLSEKVELKFPSKEIKKTVTYHDPCHLSRGQEITEAPRKILERIPGVESVEMDEPDLCCGSGGLFHLEHYEMSDRIRGKKLAMIKSTGAEIVITECPACMMHLEEGIYFAEMKQKVMHLIELVNLAYAENFTPHPSLSPLGRGLR